MTSNGTNRRFRAASYVFAGLMLVSFILLFFSTRSFIIDFKNVGLSAFSGVRGAVHGVSSFVSRTVESGLELAALRKEYDELTKRIARYEQLERSAAEIAQENIRLKEQLGFSQGLSWTHIPAQIIGRDPDNLFSAIVINKGKRDGVAYNMPVIAFQDGAQALVGKVVQAGAVESLVMPLYDVSSFVPARLAVSRYDGIAAGQGKSEFPLLMQMINKRARDDINVGDMVVTSGIGGIPGLEGAVYPADINIGRVTRIIYLEYETTMELELSPVIDFSRLEYLFVLGNNHG